MFLPVDPSSGLPVYRQITDQIRRMLVSGRLGPGERLPSIRDLATQLRINPLTVGRAYGDAGLQESLRLTRRANAVIGAVCLGTGARYVDLFKPFEESGRDVTSLMAPDGDHPNAAGHELIARELLHAGLPQTS